MTHWEEPPNHSIVGWGVPAIRGARVRIDEYVDKDDPPLERWYDISENSMEPPVSWLGLIDESSSSLYLLSQTPL